MGKIYVKKREANIELGGEPIFTLILVALQLEPSEKHNSQAVVVQYFVAFWVLFY